MHSEGDYHPILRPFKQSDLSLVMSAWVRSQIRDPRMDPELFDSAFHDRAKARLAATDTECVVLCLPDDQDTVVSFAIFDADTLHFIHTKSFYRRMGYARQLLEKVGPKKYHSCLTEKMDVLKLSSQFNPFRL